jgi:hypothetical protein
MRSTLFSLSAIALIASLAGCATAPKTPKPVAAPAPVVAPALTPGFGEMKPIPDPEPPARPAPAPRTTAPKPAATARPAPKPAAPTADAGRAAQLRGQGLESLNRGAIDRAVALLQQAKALDPGNLLIQRDLERALRIGRAVKAK